MLMQELGLQRHEHTELQARHEQLQHALRRHEQVADSVPVKLLACVSSLHGHVGVAPV